MYTTHKCKACRSGQGVFKRVSRSNSRVFQKRLQTSSLLEGFARLCKCKCFAKPRARRMVRYLKEKDDGGTTGGLSSAGTPHNNFCVHPAVHFRQGGGVAGGRGRQPQPSEGPFAAIWSVGVPHDSHQQQDCHALGISQSAASARKNVFK